MELFTDPNALKADTLVVVEGEIDAMSIWQASQGKVAVVAILGCSNANKTLGIRLHELKGKRFIVLLDADEAGKQNANRLCDKLISEHHPAVIRYLYDYLPLSLKKNPQAVKVDANEILIHHGEEMLRSMMNKILNEDNELDQIAKRIDKENAAAGNEFANPSLNMLDTARSKQLHQKITPRSRVIEQKESDPNDERRIISDALKFIPARELSRDEWFAVGCVLCRYGFEFIDFDAWSNDGDPRYSADSCRQQWASMKTNDELKDEGYKIGTLINLAKKFGYRPKNIHRRDTSDTLDTDFNGEQYISGLTEDLDNARRLATFCCERVKWMTDVERWLIWNKKGLWQRCSDKNSCLVPEASHLADLMMNHAIHLAQAEEKKKRQSLCRRL